MQTITFCPNGKPFISWAMWKVYWKSSKLLPVKIHENFFSSFAYLLRYLKEKLLISCIQQTGLTTNIAYPLWFKFQQTRAVIMNSNFLSFHKSIIFLHKFSLLKLFCMPSIQQPLLFKCKIMVRAMYGAWRMSKRVKTESIPLVNQEMYKCIWTQTKQIVKKGRIKNNKNKSNGNYGS